MTGEDHRVTAIRMVCVAACHHRHRGRLQISPVEIVDEDAATVESDRVRAIAIRVDNCNAMHLDLQLG